MRVEKSLHSWLSVVLPWMHKSRLNVFCVMIEALLRNGVLSVTGLGRSQSGNSLEKHGIKRADRLVSNKHMYSERHLIYTSIARQFLFNHSQPIVVIDWSDLNSSKQLYLLRAAVLISGRAITIYEEVHTAKTKEKGKTHKKFLEQLSEILPGGCIPIIVTDAGFRGPWFKAVENRRWHWIGRVRNQEKVRIEGNNSWQPGKELYEIATAKPQLIGRVLLAQSKQLPCTLVLYKGKPKHTKKLTKGGKQSRSAQSLKHERREREPWLLASSLPLAPKLAHKIVAIYKKRMLIETAFRDMKSKQYGFGLELSKSTTAQRYTILVMLASVAAAFATILGKATELLKQQKQFQVNTRTSKRALSLVALGKRVFAKNASWITLGAIAVAQRYLCNELQTEEYGR